MSMGDDVIFYEICDISIKIASIAIKSLIYEFNHVPSLGLVCSLSQGSHHDMDVFTFIDSSVSLIKPFMLCAEAGFKNVGYKELFENIRQIGILGEEEMFISTKGVNTHKGALFILGIMCAACARCIYENKGFDNLRNIIKFMTKGLCENELEFLNINNKSLTHGEKIYLKYKVKGIREEAEKGFPIVFDHSLKAFREFSHKSINDRLIYTLIVIMQHCIDTNIIFRNGIDCLLVVQNKAKNIINHYNISEESYKNAIDDLNIYLLENKISPGGSADILSATVFIDEIKTKVFRSEIYGKEIKSS